MLEALIQATVRLYPSLCMYVFMHEGGGWASDLNLFAVPYHQDLADHRRNIPCEDDAEVKLIHRSPQHHRYPGAGIDLITTQPVVLGDFLNRYIVDTVAGLRAYMG